MIREERENNKVKYILGYVDKEDSSFIKVQEFPDSVFPNSKSKNSQYFLSFNNFAKRNVHL